MNDPFKGTNYDAAGMPLGTTTHDYSTLPAEAEQASVRDRVPNEHPFDSEYKEPVIERNDPTPESIKAEELARFTADTPVELDSQTADFEAALAAQNDDKTLKETADAQTESKDATPTPKEVAESDKVETDPAKKDESK